MKLILFNLVLLIHLFVSSQSMQSKYGESILPERGDWSISMSIHPVINYITDVFNGLNNDFSTPTFGDDLYFHIRKFSSEKKAHRYTIGANFDTSSETWSFGLGYGLENRKGDTRLQGKWGYYGFIGIGEKINSGDWISIPTITYDDGYNMHIISSLFIGCEYFFMPKISLGAEYHYGAIMHVTDGETTFNIGNNSNNTLVKMNFYF